MSRMTTVFKIAVPVFLLVAVHFAVVAEPTWRQIAAERQTSADTPDVLLRKYLEALDRMDMDAAKVIAKQAAEQSHSPITELMIRHTRLLTAEKSSSPRKEQTRQTPIVDRKNALHTVTYNVADLVMPLPVLLAKADSSLPTTKAKKTAPGPDFDSLIDLITTTIKPTTWDTVDGPGSMAPFKANLSLVVTQTQEVHDEIVSLLEQLRRLQDITILLEAKIVVVPEGILPKYRKKDLDHGDTRPQPSWQTSGQPIGDFAGMLNPEQVKRLIETAQINGGNTALRRVTTMNGQLAVLPLPTERGYPQAGEVQAVVSNDRRYVRFTLVLDGKRTVSGSIADGNTMVVDLAPTEAKNALSRRLLLLTPKVIIAEEEEEKLGIQPADNTK
jgi:hypothetical protein